MRFLHKLAIALASLTLLPSMANAQIAEWLEDENCAGRTLSESDAEQFFDRSKIIPGIIWMHEQVATPCQLKGETTFHGAQWNYSIYPTGMGILWSEDLEARLFFKCESCSVLEDVRDFDTDD